MPRRMLRAAGLAAALPLLAGCLVQSEETGFVELKRTFVPASNRDVYRLNGQDVVGLDPRDANATVVIRQKVGPVKLELGRDADSWVLCSFDLRKNRIVTATIYLQNRDIKCGLQL